MKAFRFLIAVGGLACVPFTSGQEPEKGLPVQPSPIDKSRAPASALTLEKAVLATAPTVRSDSLLKVNVTYQSYSPHLPWQKLSPGARLGLGVVLDKNRVLVTGQMVADATYIELELPESGQKIPAKVVGADYEANLALLEAAYSGERSKIFFSDLKPMQIESKAHVGDNLSIWQTGRVGELIVTLLHVSKVMTSAYVLPGSNFLVYEGQGIVRTEGNSFTLPVIKGGKLAGLLLRYDSKNQVTTVLPGIIIEHFLKDMADRKNEGFPSLGIEVQPTMDEQFREYLGLKPSQGGMYVSGVSKGGTAAALGVEKKDILLNINGFKIDSRGDYEDPEFGRLSMSHIVRGRAYVGEKVKMVVLRNGKEVTLEGKLTRKNPKDNIVWPYLFDRGPNYVVEGGLVFQELTKPYLQAFGEDANGTVLRLSHLAEHPEEYEKQGRKKFVFLSAVLPTPATQGYERIGGLLVKSVNGKMINDLSDLDKAFQEAKDGLDVVEFEDMPKKIYLDAASVDRENTALLKGAYRIGSLKRIE
ncbi:MAG: hypothetical protein JWO89_2579 [Verrucomicrobiaceae bacterium]|nr:hypothetical protein [Verrucomicrobiaceae bacterium]